MSYKDDLIFKQISDFNREYQMFPLTKDCKEAGIDVNYIRAKYGSLAKYKKKYFPEANNKRNILKKFYFRTDAYNEYRLLGFSTFNAIRDSYDYKFVYPRIEKTGIDGYFYFSELGYEVFLRVGENLKKYKCVMHKEFGYEFKNSKITQFDYDPDDFKDLKETYQKGGFIPWEVATQTQLRLKSLALTVPKNMKYL